MKKKENHTRNIEILTARVAADSRNLEQSALKRNKNLIYARIVVDYEFDKCVNNQVSKWDMVAELWNKGFTAKTKLLAWVQEDVVFPALPDGEHATGARLQSRWEKVSKDFNFLADMYACRWDQYAHLNPPPRLNSHNPVVKPSTISAATVSPAPVSPSMAADSIPATPRPYRR
jgi:hypothetical protein